jgi:transposase
MNIQRNFIGCDIGKRFIDVFDPVSGRHMRLSNEPATLEAFAAGRDGDHDFVVLEATGHHDRALRHALAVHGIAHARLNPMQARRFAQACGRLAKTDRIDARSLAAYGATFHPSADAPPCARRERLAALARRRDQLVATRAVERRHRAEAFEADILADIEASIAALDTRIQAIEAVIADELDADSALASQAERLMSAPGIGPVAALTLIAHMPELGCISPKAAAALVGLAPFNDDSGQRSGRRSIAGGRSRLRKALYMAAFGAIRANSRFRHFYTTLAARSGSKKLAIIAVARKLLIALNAMTRDQTAFR